MGKKPKHDHLFDCAVCMEYTVFLWKQVIVSYVCIIFMYVFIYVSYLRYEKANGVRWHKAWTYESEDLQKHSLDKIKKTESEKKWIKKLNQIKQKSV